MKQRLALAFVLGVVGVVSAGCGDDGPSGTTDAGGGDAADGPMADGPGTDTPPTDTITPDGVVGDGPGSDAPAPNPSDNVGVPGGRLVSADGRIILVIPRGALSYPVEISIKAEATPPTGATGTVYEISPLGLRLLRAAKITLRYTNEIPMQADEENSRLGIYQTGQWSELPRSRPDTGVNEVSADISQLGVVGLLPGLCRVCNTTCTAGACKFGADPQTGAGGVDGQCKTYGSGCQRCVPNCDNDGDGQCPGNPGNDQPGGDCNDGDATVYSEAVEICGNGVDDDCDDYVDDGCKPCSSQTDCTGGNQVCTDGVCNICDTTCTADSCNFEENMVVVAGRCHAIGVGGCKVCVPSCDVDGDGYCPEADPPSSQPGGDCNDTNPAISPRVAEVCGNGLDDDCNTYIDDGCSLCEEDGECPMEGQTCRKNSCQGCKTDCTVGMACRIGSAPTDPMGKCVVSGKGCTDCVPNCDVDGDGYCINQTDLGPGGDCNDMDRDIFPNAAEVCGNTKDDDCDDQIDEGCQPCDSDTDCTQGSQACQEGFCEVCQANCDAATCTFGASMPEGMPPIPGVMGQCKDYGQGCSKCVPACDMDGDGVCPQPNPGNDQPGGDCNDADKAVAPNHPEVCGNMKDDDCDGLVDEACAACATALSCNANEACTTTK